MRIKKQFPYCSVTWKSSADYGKPRQAGGKWCSVMKTCDGPAQQETDPLRCWSRRGAQCEQLAAACAAAAYRDIEVERMLRYEYDILAQAPGGPFLAPPCA